MREIVRLGFILMIISALAGAALSVTYATTRPLIEEQQARALEANLRALLPDADRFEAQDEEAGKGFYLGYKGEEKVGIVALFTQGGYGGDIRMMVGVNMDGTITGLRIMEHGETPGLGAKIDEDWFKEQFKDKSTSDPFTIGEDIEAITGATISSRSVTGGIKMIVSEIEKTFLTAGALTVDLTQVPDGT
ncbi:MAG: RnfABCDGE type electron transport complex subunit G [bacterium]|jgi:electron transport complex protein RnfG